MVQFKATIEKFNKKGEKTSWTYLPIAASIAKKLNNDCKKIYRVKGVIDDIAIKQVAIMPMGDGTYIMPLNATIRKQLVKKEGDTVKAAIEVDNEPILINAELLDCLMLDEKAYTFFTSLPGSHQRYYSKWVDEAKTPITKERRLTTIINALANKWDYPTMIKNYKNL